MWYRCHVMKAMTGLTATYTFAVAPTLYIT